MKCLRSRNREDHSRTVYRDVLRYDMREWRATSRRSVMGFTENRLLAAAILAGVNDGATLITLCDKLAGDCALFKAGALVA